jgi:ketosteroid isomerase-like protein
MSISKRLAFACVITLIACGVNAQERDLTVLQKQVEETERAFARTMADRDFSAFTSFLSDETIFFAGETPLRGKQAVADAWKPFFQEPEAPFSWEPLTVVVLDSGTLALSSGPVRDPAGKQVATFNSIWRLDPGGQWQIIFDKGSDACNCPAPAQSE